MTIYQLELFIDASRTLNFTRTAEHFFISQSAVTQQMKNLEEELDVTLFSREKKKLALTEAGHVFVREAQGLIEHTKSSIEKVQAIQKGNTGHLNIGYLASMSAYELPLSIHNFHTKNPGIRLELNRDSAINLYKDFQDGKYDIIFNITATPFTYENVVEVPLRKFGFVVCLPPNHRLANHKQILQEDLQNEKLIVQNPNVDPTSNKIVIGRALDSELMDNIVAVENDTAAAAIMVAAGLGIAIMPASDIDQRKDHLLYIPLDTGGFTVSINLYYRKNHDNPAIEIFAKECKPVN